MADFLKTPVVSYVCSCGILNPISKLYFCRHCLKLRCGFCVCHEVDSHFCSSCLENIPSSEAKHRKNKCNSCFVCPCCHHTLSTRATTVNISRKTEESEKGTDTNVKIESKKMYYLSCLACRWTSRDVGIPDQSIANGAWPEMEYSHQTRFAALLEYYQAVVLQEKQEKQDFLRRKAPKQNKFQSLTDRTGLTVSAIRRQMGWSDKTPPKAEPSKINASVAREDVEELPESIFTEKVNLKTVTTIKQRHGQPAEQPTSVNDLYPQHKPLWIKRSARCRQCEHNIIKPEYHPGSIKYRIQLFANYHVPEVRLVNCVKPIKAGVINTVVLKFSNPTMHDMQITLMNLPTEDEESLIIDELKKEFDKQISLNSTPTASLSRQGSLNEEPRLVNKTTNTMLEIPNCSFLLNHRDDSAEFDEDIQMEGEEPNFIIWRKSNKVSIKLNFTPNQELIENENVNIGFSMQYSYVNTVPATGDKKNPQKYVLTSRVYVDVGKIITES